MIYFPIIVLAFWLSRARRFRGKLRPYITTAILLFSSWSTGSKYRLYSDPELHAKNKAARPAAKKADYLRLRYTPQ